MRLALLLLLAAPFFHQPARADLPDVISASGSDRVPGAKKRLGAGVDALLVTPDGAEAVHQTEKLPGARFLEACHVYLAGSGALHRRFVVYVQNREHAAMAREAGAFLAALWRAAERRFGSLSARLRAGPLKLWMARSGEGGAEQERQNLYLYDILGERPGIEWARQLAHEYGHYLLPSPSGYSEPESWANGVLGERLFLHWIAQDLESGRIAPEELPYVENSQLDAYRAMQVTPLIDVMRLRGPDAALLAGADRRAMDAFTGLMLYLDGTFGSRTLLEMLEFLPRSPPGGLKGTHFLSAFAQWAGRQETLRTISPPGPSFLYLPWKEAVVRPLDRTRELSAAGTAVSALESGWRLRAAEPGWRVFRLGGPDPRHRLAWSRRSGRY